MVGDSIKVPNEENSPAKRVERIFSMMDKVENHENNMGKNMD
jgi:hypothetical protein